MLYQAIEEGKQSQADSPPRPGRPSRSSMPQSTSPQMSNADQNLERPKAYTSKPQRLQARINILRSELHNLTPTRQHSGRHASCSAASSAAQSKHWNLSSRFDFGFRANGILNPFIEVALRREVHPKLERSTTSPAVTCHLKGSSPREVSKITGLEGFWG